MSICIFLNSNERNGNSTFYGRNRFYKYKVCGSENGMWPQKYDINRNPYFLLNYYETHELIILTMCHINWTKIVDFYRYITYFRTTCIFASACYNIVFNINSFDSIIRLKKLSSPQSQSTIRHKEIAFFPLKFSRKIGEILFL